VDPIQSFDVLVAGDGNTRQARHIRRVEDAAAINQ
jgi:hypothetical protein